MCTQIYSVCHAFVDLVRPCTGKLSQKSMFGLQGVTPGLAGSTVLSL